MRINRQVKENMRKRKPEWWRPEDEKHFPLWKEAIEQRKWIERRITELVNLIVDVGCGHGRLLLSLASKANTIVLIDISKKMIKKAKTYAKERVNNACFVVGDAENIPLRSTYADFAICLQTLVHVSSRGRAVRELKRIVKRDGFVIIDIPIHNLIDFVYWSLRHGGAKNLFADIMRRICASKSYSSSIKKKELHELLEISNLSIVDYSKVGPWDTFILRGER